MTNEKNTSKPIYVSAFYLFANGDADSADGVTFNDALQRSPDDPDGDIGHPYCGDAEAVAKAVTEGVDSVRREDDPSWFDRQSLVMVVGKNPDLVSGAYANLRAFKYREEEKREAAAAEKARADELEKALRDLIAATAASRSAAVKTARDQATRTADGA